MTTIRHRLNTNENPLGPSPRAVAAIREEAAELHRYPTPDDEALREALAVFHGRGLTPDHFFTGDSAYESLDLVARALLVPGSEYVICPPTFTIYERIGRLLGATAVRVPLREPGFSHDLDAVGAAITGATRLLYLCNPNNPTGAMLDEDGMAALLALLPRGVVLVADEVYRHFVEWAQFPDTIGHILRGREVVMIQSFSKAFGLAGLRLGYGIAPPALAATIRNFRRIFHINRLALAAGIAALDDYGHLARSMAHIRVGRRFIAEGLRRLDVEQWPSETNFIMFRPDIPAERVYHQLLERGIALRWLVGDGLPDHLRVTVGTDEANQAFLNALGAILGAT